MKAFCRFGILLFVIIVTITCNIISLAEDVLILPASLQIIEEEAFYASNSIRQVILSENVKEIHAGAFANSSISEVNLPKSITYIADDAFDCCINEDIHFIYSPNTYAADWVKAYHLNHGIYSDVDDFSFDVNNGQISITGYTGERQDVIIPPVIEGYPVCVIGANAFSESTILSSIVFPSTITKIENSAFSGCTSLTEVYLPEGLETIEGRAFANCKSLQELHLPDSITTLDYEAFAGCTSLSSVNYPRNWSVLDHGMWNSPFYNCTSLTSMIVPDGVTQIPAYAFYNCSSLVSIDLPDSITDIGEQAFEGCISLKSIEIPEKVKTIQNLVFGGCTNLTEVSLPEGLETIEGNAFANCKSLQELHLPDSITTLYYEAFAGCTNLSSVNYPRNWSVLDHGMWNSPFYECTSLTSMVIPDGVTTIPAYAFYGCIDLKQIEIPYTVSAIGTSAFYNATELTIFGRKGSFAEIYADQNAIPFSTVNTIVMLDGTVTSGSAGVRGITVSVFDSTANQQAAIVSTNEDGAWRISGLTRGHSYRITYSSSNYDVLPNQVNVVAVNGSEPLHATAALHQANVDASRISATCDVDTVETGVPVTFVIASAEATELRLIVDDVVYEQYDCAPGGGKIQRAFAKAGERNICFQMGVNGEWGVRSNTIPLTVTNSKGTLEKPVVTVESVCQRGQDLYVMWTDIPNKERYTVYLFRYGAATHTETVTDNKFRIPGEWIDTDGAYSVEVVASSAGYSQNSGYADFTVLDKGISITTDENMLGVGESMTVTVAGSKADYLRLTVLLPDGTENTETYWTESKSINYTFTQEGEYVFHAEAGHTNMEAPFASCEKSVLAIRGLSLEETIWQPQNASETLTVKVNTDTEWTISECSSWLRAVKGDGEFNVSVDSDNIAGKEGYILIKAGNAEAYLHVYGPGAEIPLVITSPAQTTIDNLNTLNVTWQAVDGVNHYLVAVYDRTFNRCVYYSEIKDQTTEASVPAGLLLDAHQIEIQVVARFGEESGNERADVSASKTVTVAASNTATVNGRIECDGECDYSMITIRVCYGDQPIINAIVQDDGTWSCSGLTVNGRYSFCLVYDGTATAPKELTLKVGENTLDKFYIEKPDGKENVHTIELKDEDQYVLYYTQAPVKLVSSEKWLLIEQVTDESGTWINLSIDPEKDETEVADLTVSFSDEPDDVIRVTRKIFIEVDDIYLAGKGVTEEEPSYNFINGTNSYYTWGSGSITDNLRRYNNDVEIREGHTIYISDDANCKDNYKYGCLEIKSGVFENHDLKIYGTLILRSGDTCRLRVDDNVIVYGSLIIEGCNCLIEGDLQVKDGGKVTISKNSNVTINGELSLDGGTVTQTGGELTAFDRTQILQGHYVLDNGTCKIWGKMEIIKTGYMTMNGGTVNTGDLVFNSKKASWLTAGTISVLHNVELLSGYVATSEKHRLEVNYTKKDTLSWRSSFKFAKDKGQQIGTLFVKDTYAVSGNYAESDYLYCDGFIPSGNTVDISFDEKTLKLALTFTNCGLFDIKGITGKDNDLSVPQKAAIILKYLEVVAANGKDIGLTSMSLYLSSSGEEYTAYYYNEKGIYTPITFSLDTVITMTGKTSLSGAKTVGKYVSLSGNISASNTIGTAWITVNDKQYTINAKDMGSLSKAAKCMLDMLTIDGTKIIWKTFTKRVNSNNAFGKDGVIIYLIDAFKTVGIGTEGLSTLPKLNSALEAETDKEFLKAIKELIQQAVKMN